MQEFGGLLLLIGIGGVCIVLAEMLCRSLGLDRMAAKPEEYDDADATFRQIEAEIEREAAQITKRCGAEP